MKNIKNIAISFIVAIVAFAAAPTTGAETTSVSSSAISSVISNVPSCLTVEQTATLDNGKTIRLYYKKSGNLCEVYSPDNLKGYTPNDLLRIKSSTFTLVSDVKGKRVYHCTVAQAASMLKKLANLML